MRAGWLFVAGTVLFSGSLYALALTGVRWLGAITPLGGAAFLAGWVCLALGGRPADELGHPASHRNRGVPVAAGAAGPLVRAARARPPG